MTDIVLFQDKKIRRHRDEGKQEWLFSVVDIVGILSQSERPRKYWSDLKKKLKDEGYDELSEKIGQLKMESSDGKKYMTDVANDETMLRIIQSIPSPHAEPIKRRLAQLGSERIDEMNDPEQAMHRAMKYYTQKGYDEARINQRLKSIEIRKELTDERKRVGVKEGKEYAILTNEITKARSGMTVKEYKKLKSLKKESLRDNMTNIELVLNMLAEASTTEISQSRDPKDFDESKEVAQAGGSVASKARKELEDQTGKPLVTPRHPHPSLEGEEGG